MARSSRQLFDRLVKSGASSHSSKLVIYAALAGNFLVALTKLWAAIWTGSSAMLSESIHSVVDMGNEFLLLYGLCRANQRPDHDHPLGYGREVYFWSFVVAVLIFTLGAGLSIYGGIHHILDPDPVENVVASYLVLLAAAVFEGCSWRLTLSRFKGGKSYAELPGAVLHSKDPPTFIVLLEDTAAILGIIAAFAGIWLSQHFNEPVWDGVASIVIGVILAATAGVLAQETKGLLIGERAHQEVLDSILAEATSLDGVAGANGVLTAHLAPHQILAALSVEFEDHLATPQIEALVIEMETRLHALHPEIVALFIKPQTAGRFRDVLQRQHNEGPAK
ncbi:MAG: cation transporter [Burkholderiaceae bacterium]|nr:cation transporter [Burkholderiaceae bacterium]